MIISMQKGYKKEYKKMAREKILDSGRVIE
jgi:hypothetical protein